MGANVAEDAFASLPVRAFPGAATSTLAGALRSSR
jgi:hypothetical protein